MHVLMLLLVRSMSMSFYLVPLFWVCIIILIYADLHGRLVGYSLFPLLFVKNSKIMLPCATVGFASGGSDGF